MDNGYKVQQKLTMKILDRLTSCGFELHKDPLTGRRQFYRPEGFYVNGVKVYTPYEPGTIVIGPVYLGTENPPTKAIVSDSQNCRP